MQKKESFVVTCKKCHGHSRIMVINDKDVVYQDHIPIISSRLRPDLTWGFECQCGNNSLVAPEEAKDLDFLVQHTDELQKKNIIKEISQRLKNRPVNLFKMERA